MKVPSYLGIGRAMRGVCDSPAQWSVDKTIKRKGVSPPFFVKTIGFVLVSFVSFAAFINHSSSSRLWSSDQNVQVTSREVISKSCIATLVNCDLTCLDWTIVLSMGRSGSTTIQEMISKLPGMNFYGEEGGLLTHLKAAQDTISKPRRWVSWKGSEDKNMSTIACMAQKFYSERHGQTCLERGCRHGWKEIRYRTRDQIHWLQTLFPAARIILNYRDECQNYTDVFKRNCSVVDRQKKDFLKSAENLTNSFHMKFEDINNLERFRELSVFLGYDCEALQVLQYNTNRTGSKTFQDDNPWECLTVPPRRP